MAAERPVDPQLVQHVEAVRDELRAERRALEALPRENARLRSELEQLEARKKELQGELEALQRGQPVSIPKLPEVLSAPFDVNVRHPRGMLSKVMFVAIFAALFVVLPHGLEKWRYVLPLWGLLAATSLAVTLFPHRLRFGESDVKETGISLQKDRLHVRYAEIYDVQVLVTPSQRRRGVGTLVIRYGFFPPEHQTLLRNVPDPERLAEWLRGLPGLPAKEQPNGPGSTLTRR